MQGKHELRFFHCEFSFPPILGEKKKKASFSIEFIKKNFVWNFFTSNQTLEKWISTEKIFSNHFYWEPNAPSAKNDPSIERSWLVSNQRVRSSISSLDSSDRMLRYVSILLRSGPSKLPAQREKHRWKRSEEEEEEGKTQNKTKQSPIPDTSMAAEPRDGGFEKEKEEEEAAAERAELLRDRFRLSVISIANAEGFDSPFSTLSLFVFFSSKSFFLISLRAAEKVVMGISEPVVACIADLAFKYTGLISKTLTLGCVNPFFSLYWWTIYLATLTFNFSFYWSSNYEVRGYLSSQTFICCNF